MSTAQRRTAKRFGRTLLDELCLLQTLLDPLPVRADIRPEALVQPLRKPVVGVWVLSAQVVELCDEDEVKVGRESAD